MDPNNKTVQIDAQQEEKEVREPWTVDCVVGLAGLLFSKADDVMRQGKSQRSHASFFAALDKMEMYLTANDKEPILQPAKQLFPQLRKVAKEFATLSTSHKKGAQRALDIMESIMSEIIQRSKQVEIEIKFPPSMKIPVVVLTGFLGSGKTTLLNRILGENHGLRIAVIENEFGEVGIDDALVKQQFNAAEEIFEMNNGCICCTVRGDLVRICKSLLKKRDKFDMVVIETTGLADPAPIAQTFFVEEELSWQIRLDGIVTVVDAKHILQHLHEVKPDGAENEAVEQIAFADRIVLNKTDLVTEIELQNVKKEISAINSSAKVLGAVQANVDLSEVLNIHAFDLDRVLSFEPEFLKEGGQHTHDKTVSSVGCVIDGDLDPQRWNVWLRQFLMDHGADIYRMKGVVSLKNFSKKWVFQGVHMLLDRTEIENWAPGEKRHSKVVFIGKNLNREAIISSLQACSCNSCKITI